MSNPPDTGQMTPISEIPTEYGDEGEEMVALAGEAAEFLGAFGWCNSIRRGFLADAWSAQFAVFYFEIEPAAGADERIWVVAGDVPPAYLDIESCPNVRKVVETYVWLMEEWVDVVRKGGSTDALMPVLARGSSHRRLPPKPENAEMLARRLALIRKHVFPDLDDPDPRLGDADVSRDISGATEP